MDLYFTQAGDLAVSSSGDLALTQTEWRDDVQQVYVRLMTDAGDYIIYPELGASLSTLYGLPQSQATGERGISLIRAALDREGRFLGKNYRVDAIPDSYQSIRFDVYISTGSRDQVRLSIEQALGI